jgi:hypothetical protein
MKNADPHTTEADRARSARFGAIPNEMASRVKKVTTMDVLIEVRKAFITMPAVDFNEWLIRRLEQVERMP